MIWGHTPATQKITKWSQKLLAVLLFILIGFSPAQAQFAGGEGRGDFAFTQAEVFFPAIQTALDTAVEEADALERSDYTAQSWAALQEALNLPETTNAEVEAKTAAINDAIAALVIPVPVVPVPVNHPLFLMLLILFVFGLADLRLRRSGQSSWTTTP